MSIWQDILDFILPPRCLICGKIVSEEGLCSDCFNKITFISEPYCRCCGLPFDSEQSVSQKMLCPHCLKDKKPLFRFSRAAIKYEEFSKIPRVLG